MLKILIRKWDQNKYKLEKAFREGTDFNNCEYLDLVKMTFNIIFNEEIENDVLNIDEITEIDNGDYQGTLLYLIPFDCYQPSERDYLMTYVNYGSCSSCDTLQGIQDYGNKHLSDGQVSDFMALCKDLITNTIKPYNSGWRKTDDYTDVKLQRERNRL